MVVPKVLRGKKVICNNQKICITQKCSPVSNEFTGCSGLFFRSNKIVAPEELKEEVVDVSKKQRNVMARDYQGQKNNFSNYTYFACMRSSRSLNSYFRAIEKISVVVLTEKAKIQNDFSSKIA